jgi:lipoate-protein ligase B
VSLVWEDLGTASWDEAHRRQLELRAERLQGQGADTLLTVEHPPVLTAGRRADPADLLGTVEELEAEGIAVRRAERGGSWTWHGPGQLVAYPIVRLPGWGLTVPDFVAGLELAMVELTRRALERCGADPLEAGRRCGYPGAWITRDGRPAKVGAVGVHVRRFVSLHGLAWNLDLDPWGFDRIVPCGLHGVETTSVRRLVVERGGDPERLPTVGDSASALAELLPTIWRGELSVRSCSFA